MIFWSQTLDKGQVYSLILSTSCLVAMAPSVILVLLLQKFVVQGLAAGAVKG